MIIMRALVATVLLITVVLVSIVLINANSRIERSSETFAGQNEDSKAEVDKSEVEVMFENSFERMGLSPQQEGKSFEMVENLTESEKSINDSSLINAIKKAGKVMETEQAEANNTSRDTSGNEENRVEEDAVEEHVVIVPDNESIESVEIPEDALNTADEVRSPTTEPPIGGFNLENAPAQQKQQDNEASKETYFESKTLNDIKARSKESRKSSPTTERQTPLGYEPESYIVLDEEQEAPVKTSPGEGSSEVDDLDPNSSISSRPLERKQRAVVGTPETIVLNRAPIVPHVSAYEEPGCRHIFPPSLGSRFAKPVKRALSSHPAMPSIIEPNHWDNEDKNKLQIPQCAACQRKKLPLCVTCGQCRECCDQSECTCGCLNSQ